MSAGEFEAVTVGPIQTNCYLVDDGRGCVMLVDPGAQWGLIERALAGRPVSLIAITHFHDDHAGALNEAVRATGAPWVIGAPDARMLDGSVSLEASYMSPVAERPPQRMLADGDALQVGDLTLGVIACPGHTPGGVTYVDAAHGLAFVGDTLFAGSAGRTDLFGGDARALASSLARLAQLPPATRVLPGHGAFSTIAVERAQNRFMAGL